jgi:hypothetical protein
VDSHLGISDDPLGELFSVRSLARWSWANLRIEEGANGPVLAWTTANPDLDHSPQEEFATPKGILKAFLALGGKSDAQAPGAVLAFARRYGPLMLCEHEVFGGHHALALEPYPRPMRLTECPPSQREPVAAWQRYAREAAAPIKMAADLRGGRVPQADQAVLAGGAAEGVRLELLPLRLVQEEWHRLVWKVNQWLRSSQALPQLAASAAGQPTLLFGEETAASAIAVELLYAVLRKDSRLCDVCGGVLDKQRAPKAGTVARCTRCAAQARRDASRERQRRHRDRSSSA